MPSEEHADPDEPDNVLDQVEDFFRLGIDIGHPEAKHDLAVVLAMRGKTSEAAPMFQQALAEGSKGAKRRMERLYREASKPGTPAR